jgi:REP element-mobilizing transposase RayT
MSRQLRFIPEGGGLVEVTCRTLQSRLLLRPSRVLNELVLGVLGRAQKNHSVRCCNVVFASNHYHLLLWVADAEQLSDFMEYVNSNLAREAGRLVGWRDKFWSRRYQAILISDEESAQVARFRYILAHGVKEGLVSRVRDWPGVHAVRALLYGEPLKGTWYSRTQEYAARQRGEDFPARKYTEDHELFLSPLPCWAHISEEEIRKRIAVLVQEIEEEAATDRALRGIPVLGVEAILRQDPHSLPKSTKKSPAPSFHAATFAALTVLRNAYNCFLEAFRKASETWKVESPTKIFPPGSFPPGPPFVRAGPST